MFSKFNESSKFVNFEKKSVNFKKKIIKKFNNDAITFNLNQIERVLKKLFIINDFNSNNESDNKFKLIIFLIC